MKNKLIFLAFLLSFGSCALASDKPKRPKYNSYKIAVSNAHGKDMLKGLADQQSYSAVFITPAHRRACLAYYNSKIDKNISREKAKKKYIDYSEKLAHELEEFKYQKFNQASWDNSSAVTVVVAPTLRVFQMTYGYYTSAPIYYSNKQMIETALLVDHDLNPVCKPLAVKDLGMSSHVYIESLYSYFRSLDHNLAPKVYIFSPQCFEQDDLQLLVKNFSARAATAKIPSKIKKTITKDFI